MAAVVCDFLAGFGAGQSSFALALDLKGAFNAVLPDELFKQLRDLGLPGRLINFISFLTAKRKLFFSAEDTSHRVCGVGVPQGGVLSPILFNLHLRLLNGYLPPDVRAAMYADDLLLYVRGSDSGVCAEHAGVGCDVSYSLARRLGPLYLAFQEPAVRLHQGPGRPWGCLGPGWRPPCSLSAISEVSRRDSGRPAHLGSPH